MAVYATSFQAGMHEVLCATRSPSGGHEQSLLHSDEWRDCKPSEYTLNFMQANP
jgi:hypothetical protein